MEEIEKYHLIKGEILFDPFLLISLLCLPSGAFEYLDDGVWKKGDNSQYWNSGGAMVKTDGRITQADMSNKYGRTFAICKKVSIDAAHSQIEYYPLSDFGKTWRLLGGEKPHFTDESDFENEKRRADQKAGGDCLGLLWLYAFGPVGYEYKLNGVWIKGKPGILWHHFNGRDEYCAESYASLRLTDNVIKAYLFAPEIDLCDFGDKHPNATPVYKAIVPVGPSDYGTLWRHV
jgi:hypothetical protein